MIIKGVVLIGGVVVILRMVMVLMEIIKIISDTSGHDVQKRKGAKWNHYEM